MRVIAKTSFAGLDFNAIPGQVLDLPADIAKDLVQAGYAEAEEKKTAKPKTKGTTDK